jgi:putative DNA primase/helicase
MSLTREQRSALERDAKGGDGAAAHLAALSSIEREEIRWLWEGLIPRGMLTLLIGDPGLGKSLLALLLGSWVSRGGGDVLILSAEDHAGATIRPRAEAVEADLDRLHIVGMRRDGLEDGLALPDDAAELDRVAKETGARLVIVDPLMAHLPESVNSWRDQSVRRALAPLHHIAEEHGASVLLIAHLNKARGADPLYRAGGSIGIPAAVRSALLLARDPEDPQEQRGSRRVLAHIKCNVALQAKSLACSIDTVQLAGELVAPRLRITGTSATSASELLDAPMGEERTARDEAASFLREELGNGPQEAKTVRKAARDAGIADRTLDRAKKSLGVQAKKDGLNGPWRWHFEERHTEERHPHIPEVASFDEQAGNGPSEGGSDPEGRHDSDRALFDGNGRSDDHSDLKLDPAEVERIEAECVADADSALTCRCEVPMVMDNTLDGRYCLRCSRGIEA